MKKKLLGADYLLLLLYLNNKESIKGSVRLIKMMFLFEEQIAPILKNQGLESEQLPQFISYNFGPFSKDVYEQIELFTGIGFAEKKNLNAQEEMSEIDDIIENEFLDECYENDTELKNDNNFWEYRILESGSGFVEKNILCEISDEQLAIMKRFKKKITDMTIKQLLYYVYTTYPQYTERSIIKDEVLHNGN